MWDEFLALAAGLMPLPRLAGQLIFALIFGFGTGGVAALVGFEAQAPFVAVFAFIVYMLIAVLIALRHRP